MSPRWKTLSNPSREFNCLRLKTDFIYKHLPLKFWRVSTHHEKGWRRTLTVVKNNQGNQQSNNQTSAETGCHNRVIYKYMIDRVKKECLAENEKCGGRTCWLKWVRLVLDNDETSVTTGARSIGKKRRVSVERSDVWNDAWFDSDS